MKKITLVAFLVACLVSSHAQIQWPAITKTAKPWTYWWWMGSSVTRQGITQNLEDLHTVGIGGVHIIPIYGEKGDEHNFVKYLSPEWMELLKHTANEAKRLGMGVDMTAGTGWPFGGPNVSPGDAAKVFYVKAVKIKDHANVRDYQKTNDNTNLLALAAYDEKGNYVDITPRVDSDGLIHWGEVQKTWKVYAAFQSFTQQKVKRAAPGGEGLVIDYFNDSSILNYMKTFEDAFNQAGIEKGNVRSFYNDSYEVYGANWTPDFLPEFRKRRGYDLLPYINYLADTSNVEMRQRVVTDYCETISDLLYDRFTKNWVKKSHEMGMITRNQAHGSPGNLLDLYALADIPETEAFGASGFLIPGLRQDADYEEDRFGRPNPLTMKFASSAAHVGGRKLVSSETTTWLGDHFKVSLSQIKPQIDELFVSGINHVFFHGTTYSPKEKPFPGRLFYASTNYGPSSHFWNELPALTGYISKCQTILQHTKQDNDILLYFPVHDMWKKQKSELIISLNGVHNTKDWLQSSPFGYLAQRLWANGYTFDYISDRMIAGLNVEGKTLVSGKAGYKVIVVPSIEHIPLETLTRLRDLARKGATILFEKDIPADVPGLFDFEKRKALVAAIRNDMLLLPSNVQVTSQLLESLPGKRIYAEEMVRKGLEFVRKQSGDSTFYFIANLSDRFSEDWVQLATQSKAIEIYDPINERRGNATIRNTKTGTEIYLQLYPGQSCILTCTNKKIKKQKWGYLKADETNKQEIKGEWLLRPTQGAPEIPAPVTLQHPGSWTALGGKYETFSGKAIYSNSFEVSAELLSAKGFLLDLGNVRETARVKINGKDLGLVWCLPNKIMIPAGIIQEKNTIEIEVTNLSFNRIIQLDRDGGKWKNYHEINFVNIRYQPFDASNKKPEDSGLLSEIYLTPFTAKEP
ncbi:MAG: glycosyl hydrolase family 2 [Lentimicrobiaceae bacterium]|nr:glycosyl hydrolase family 2 [Lentimicrobiaceae bacterium]